MFFRRHCRSLDRKKFWNKDHPTVHNNIIEAYNTVFEIKKFKTANSYYSLAHQSTSLVIPDRWKDVCGAGEASIITKLIGTYFIFDLVARLLPHELRSIKVTKDHNLRSTTKKNTSSKSMKEQVLFFHSKNYNITSIYMKKVFFFFWNVHIFIIRRITRIFFIVTEGREVTWQIYVPPKWF